MAGTDNLKPFKPGESGNPNGRPKGRRSLSTMVRDFLEKDVDFDKLPLKNSEEFSNKYPTKVAGEVLVISAYTKAIEGEPAAREWLRRSGYGDKIDITSDDKPLPILGGLIVQTNDSVEPDSPDAEADQGDSGRDVSGQDDSDPADPDSDSPDQE